MKYVEEYRDMELVKKLSGQIHKSCTRPWSLMEICGGQTHSIMKYNIEEFLPKEIRLIHGPGCPVCVTPIELIDKAILLAGRKDVILASFGDMLRVPGSESDLLKKKAGGGDIRMVYSPLDAVKIAEKNSDKKVVFFAVGFETTAPANAFALLDARRKGLNNFFLLSSHVLVPPAIKALLSDKGTGIDAFLAAGHVCTVMGYREYIPLAEEFNVPIVVTGFEPVDILQGILAAVKQLEKGEARVENQYSRVVTKDGNLAAQASMNKVFKTVDRKWRGIGNIPLSGLGLNNDFAEMDAEKVFSLEDIQIQESSVCIAGEILQGKKKPTECPAFGTDCNPDNPLGAPMVSSEGACAAYYRFGKTGEGK